MSLTIIMIVTVIVTSGESNMIPGSMYFRFFSLFQMIAKTFRRVSHRI